MIKGAIFDFDGTLFDSMYIWKTIGEDYLRSIGYTPRENLNKTFLSMSLYQAVCYYRSEYGVTLSVDEITNGVNRMIERYYKDVIQPKNNIKVFLQNLKDNGVKMCIATATDKYLVEAALSRCGMDGYFSEIFTCSSVGFAKDKPVIYREAMQHLDTQRQNTFVFEDALYAVKTAKADGFIVVGVYDEFEKKQAELKETVDIFLADYLDVEDFRKFASNH